jgi:ATP/maltotriose-dependent transcriptional regulator MalT/DNA-binding SARP family transcriptional activator
MELPLILQTKIKPPSIQSRTLVRLRVRSLLAEALNYRLTVMQAGAGYGKSTALAIISREAKPVIWYQVSKEDSDPLVFLQYLCYATRVGLPNIEGLPLQLLEAWDINLNYFSLSSIIDQYINALSERLDEPCLLVIDDVHLILEIDETVRLLDRLIGLAPPDLHILLSTRPKLQLPNLYHWQNRGEVLSLDQSVLAFTPEEITSLFAEVYGSKLSRDEAGTLSEVTEGWAIALQLVWQSLRTGTIASIEEAFSDQESSLERLFDVLAQEVFSQQPEDIQDFMKRSSTLRVMTPAACDALLGTSESKAMMAFLRRQELFVVDLGNESLRYHNIFHQFLRQMTEPDQMRAWHQRAAAFYTARKDFDSGIYHFLEAEDFTGAARLLNTYGHELLTMGRLNTLAMYLDEMPPETLRNYPALLSYMGDLGRLHSRFQEALGWYQQAESLWLERGQLDGVGRALRGQARVYLDTVNPHRAEELLQKALRLSDGTADREAQAGLYELLAENKLNAGKPEEAENLRQQAESLRREGPGDSQLLIRVMLRTGRLAEARRKLEELEEAESREPVKTPRSHRETHLLLSVIYAMQGLPEEALRTAVKGTRRGEALDSPFIIGVGHMRQGHAILLRSENQRFQKARQQFEKAIEISRALAIPRLRIEACWGLCQTYGRQGNLLEAQRVADEGIEIATQVGDEWIASLVRLAMGVNHFLAGDFHQALNWLDPSVRGFQECSDTFGAAAARLWLCLGWFQQSHYERLSQSLPDLLSACQQFGYEYLFTRPTLLGPFDERLLVPLLIYARDQRWGGAFPAKLLQEMGLPGITLHPGYQLRVETLGTFDVWRGDQKIPYRGWRRDKSRQLFQLFITYRHTSLDRDQFCEHLWPKAEAGVAKRNFKVALNNLYNVLEPDREPGSESAYITREGTLYGIRPGADIWVDAEEFATTAKEAEGLIAIQSEQVREKLKDALGLYQGEYLPDARYQTWAAIEREHLMVLFLQTADTYCEICLQNESFEDVINISQRILGQDNCWERAYRHLMQAYHQLGDHGQVARTYQRCVETLQDELNVSPAPETEALYQRLTQIP